MIYTLVFWAISPQNFDILVEMGVTTNAQDSSISATNGSILMEFHKVVCLQEGHSNFGGYLELGGIFNETAFRNVKPKMYASNIEVKRINWEKFKHHRS